jgi:hypothetical protein
MNNIIELSQMYFILIKPNQFKIAQQSTMSYQNTPSATLFGELRARLSKDAWSAVKIDTLERTVLDMYTCIELFAKMHPCKALHLSPDLRWPLREELRGCSVDLPKRK